MNFSFTVTPSGRITNVRHIETQPREIEEFTGIVGRSLRRLIYRPRMENAQVVPTFDVIYTHEFYYRPSDLPEPPPADEAGPEPVGEE